MTADTIKEVKPYTVDDSNGDLVFETAKRFQEYAEQLEADFLEKQNNNKNSHNKKNSEDRPIWFLYKGIVYDCSQFAAHPGGSEILYQYHGKDITVTFHDEYNEHGHSGSALNMMLQYRVGRVAKRLKTTSKGRGGGEVDDERYDEYEAYGLEELTAYPKITDDEIIYNNFTLRRDKGLIWQAMFLPFEDYLHLISVPIYLPYCRLFDMDLFEPFSKTKYWLIMALWLPLSCFWTARGVLKDYSQLSPKWGSCLDRYLYYPNPNWIFHNYPANTTEAMASYVPAGATVQEVAEAQLQHAREISSFSLFNVILVWSLGVLLWTFMEYFIHRYPFHFERAIPAWAMEYPFFKWLHLLLHGIHHIIPMDPDRLVFPPALFVVASFLIYNLYGFIFNGSLLDILAGGVVFGYVCYDEIHYYIHHVDPKDFYFKDLKKYHHAHHFVDDKLGYGISSKLWDLIFGTACRKN